MQVVCGSEHSIAISGEYRTVLSTEQYCEVCVYKVRLHSACSLLKHTLGFQTAHRVIIV